MIVGIDFSMTSAAVCIMTNEKTAFINFPRNYSRTSKSKEWIYHKELEDLNAVKFVSFEATSTSKLDYSSSELVKIKNSDQLSDLILNELIKECKDSEVFFAIEGFSYGSKGNSFIDLIAFNSVFRNKVHRKWMNKLTVISPSEVKKFATGKGNSGKEEMYRSFVDSNLKDVDLWKWCKKNPDFEKIPKPLDDLIDAYYVASAFKNLQETDTPPLQNFKNLK